MSYKKFTLSFAATALLASPFAINAKAPIVNDDIAVAPAFGENAIVDGLHFSSAIVKQDTKTATIRISAKNNTKKEVRTEVAAALMQRPATSPMARMVPMPQELAQNKVALRLSPGETFTKTITFKLPEFVTKELERSRAAEKRNASKTPPNSGAGDLSFMNLMNAPAFFPSVRAIAPTPSPQAQQVASK